MKSRAIVLALLGTAAMSAPAVSRDLTHEILAQPSMSKVSRPLEEDAAKPTPVVTAKPAPVAEPEAKVEITAEMDAPSATPAAVPVAGEMNFLDVLARAYADSPVLRAEREALRAKYEDVAQAEAYYRPTISIEGGITAQHTDYDPGTKDDFLTKDAGLSATQYIYRGGRTLAEVDRQLRLSDAAQAAYDAVVEDTLLKVATAALDIQRDRATIDLNEKNRELLARRLSAAEKGFEVGELTRTDVAQSKARLSGAEAALVSARSSYSNALARYRDYAGDDGSDLVLGLGIPLSAAPTSLESALAAAEVDHPSIRAAKAAEEAAIKAVAVAEGGLLPTVYASGSLSQAWDPTAVLDESSGASLGLRASMPLYEGGATRSEIRQAKLGTYEQRSRVQAAKRSVEQAVTTAWNDYTSALASIDAYKRQVEAAQLARDGVYKEREVGQRTILDTLNADAELLDARVGLVKAQRDAAVAVFALASATGSLTAEKLGLAGAPRPEEYLESARANILGTSADPLQ